MKILVSGASGLVGRALVPALREAGHAVGRLVRPGARAGEGDVAWDPTKGTVDEAALAGTEAVVHLAGDGVAEGRWTEEKKRRIRLSRTVATKGLAEALARMAVRPKVLVSASAIGLYGDRGGELLTEASPPGTGFLPEVCAKWEAAADPARATGIRVAHLRIGLVLSPEGGALQKMLLPFKLGVGGILGSGAQYMSWISLTDLVRVIRFALDDPRVEGALNAVGPAPATNAWFTEVLGRVLHRPTLFPVPAFAARLVFGEMADALLLASARVEPRRLLELGFRFQDTDLEPTLARLVGA